MKKLLIVVDMQNDFITGALGSKMAEATYSTSPDDGSRRIFFFIRRNKLPQTLAFTAVVVIEKRSGKLVTDPEIISRGFIYMRESEELIQDARSVVKNCALQFEKKHKSEWANIKNSIRTQLKEHLYNKTKRTPMIMPIVIEV